MHDKMNFEGETFPLEVLESEFGESESSFEFGELEEERGLGRGGRGGGRGGGGRFRQGFSARRRPPARFARQRRRQYPRPGSSRQPWPPGPRWPYVAWPIGGNVNVIDADGTAPQTCTCGANAAAATPPPQTADGEPPDTAANGGDGADQELFGNIANRIGGMFGRAVDALSDANIIDLTASADKSHRKGTRDPKTVYALVLHQMACCFAPKDPLKRFLTIGAHFAIANDGRILQLHPISSLLWASNGFNARSVAVEFAGNFPNTRGKWWKGDTYGMNRPTPAQITAGRQLIRYLMRTMGLTHVLAHRQSSGTRENDPGPDVWFDVGQWAVNTLGLKDGGPGFKIDSGNAIPDEWRTWGSRRPAVTKEFGYEDQQEMPDTEIAHDVWDREHYEQSEQELLMHNRYCGCRRCASGAGSFEAEFLESETEAGFAGESGSELSEEEEVELALELLSVSSEAELDQFLGKLVKGAWKGLKKVGSVVGKIAKPLGGVLRAVAKKALPMVGGALGSFIPIPGVGTAVGSALGSAIGKALEAEAENEAESGDDRELAIARRFVRIATDSARQAALAPAGMDGETAANQAVASAARKYLASFQAGAPGIAAGAGGQQGRWIRRGRQVVVLGA